MTAFSNPGVDVTLLQDQGQLGRINAGAAKTPRAHNESELKEVAKEFEAMFLSQLVKPMFEGIETDEMFGGGPGEDMFKGLLVEEYGKAISRAGGVGIAEQVQNELLRLQEARGR
jgi:Rod binding domain-containing protein